jgi:hypothetical protein
LSANDDGRTTSSRKKNRARKSRPGDTHVHTSDLMEDLQSLSSLNTDLEKEIEEVRYKGTGTFNFLNVLNM